MKKTTYKCDRCGAELGEDCTALEQQRFSTHERIAYRLRFFGGKWKDRSGGLIVWELCTSCRESLDDWLEAKREARDART